jgi:hypothetical protein
MLRCRSAVPDKRMLNVYQNAPDDGRTGWFSNLPHEKPLPMVEARQVPSGEWLRQLPAT